jgi:sugar phosphate permease
MQFTITSEQIYFGIFIFVSLMQMYLIRKIDKTKDEIIHQNKEIQKIWEQIGMMASTIAIKHLELEKEVSKLKDKQEKE